METEMTKESVLETSGTDEFQSAADANDSGLLSLSLNPGTISFDPAVTEYQLTVDEGVSKIVVQAETQTGATYIVTGNDTLQPGINTMTIEVTNAEGKLTVYQLEVTVGEAVAEDEEAVESISVNLSSSSSAPVEYNWLYTSVIGIAVVAFLLWILYFVKRNSVKRDQKEYEQKKKQPRKKEDVK